MLEDARIRSLYIMHFSMLVIALGASIIFTGVYPYLVLLDPKVTIMQYGLVVAADALGQAVFSPLVGFITDRVGHVRIVAMVLALLFCAGNVCYALISLVPRCFEDDLGLCIDTEFERGLPRVWATFIARFIVGIGTALNTTSRAYVSKVTTMEERTTHISLLMLAQTVGFIMGPAVQAAVTPIGEKSIGSGSEVVFDMYTFTGWISAFNGAIAFIVYLPGIFVEFTEPPKKERPAIALGVPTALPAPSTGNVVMSASATNLEERAPPMPMAPVNKALRKVHNRELLKQFSRVSVIDPSDDLNVMKEEQQEQNLQTQQSTVSGKYKIDYIPAFIAVYAFFSFFMNFVLLETLVTPIALHQWSWSEEDTILYVGITMAAGGVLSMFCFSTIGPLSKRFDERILIIFVGMIPMIIGRMIQMPFGNDYPGLRGNLTHCDNWEYPEDANASSSFSGDRAAVDSLTGCPFCWCIDTPKMTVTQFMVGYTITTVGYPFSVALISSLYSKVLGMAKQGIWMGMLTMAGSAARVVGPLFFTWLYENLGIYATFGVLASCIAVSLILIVVFYRRFVPANSIVKAFQKEGEDNDDILRAIGKPSSSNNNDNSSNINNSSNPATK